MRTLILAVLLVGLGMSHASADPAASLRLHAQLVAEGIPVVAVRESENAYSVVLDTAATQTQRDRATFLCSNPPVATQAERADAASGSMAGRVRLALLLRASTRWTDGTLTAAEKTTLQGWIDSAADAAIVAIR